MFALLAMLAAVVAAGGATQQVRRVERVPLKKKELVSTGAPPGLKVFADNSPDITRDENAGTWWPDYVRSDGCKTFKWGVCISTLVSDLAAYDGQKWAGTAHDVGRSIANIWSIGDWGLGDIATWLLDQLCIRMQWGLYKYYWRMDINDPSGGQQLPMWEVDRKAGDLFAPEHPLPYQPGWDRVWVNEPRNPTRLDSKTRSPSSLLVYYPSEHQTIELLGKAQIRRLLRMQAPGSLNPDDLDAINCGTRRKQVSVRSKAMELYK